jgi:excisionase family DNA binding protein
MSSPAAHPVFSDFLLVRAAAAYLGVSANTLRSWDREGKLKAVRHPMNGYRLYARGDLDKLLASLAVAPLAGARTARERALGERGARA